MYRHTQRETEKKININKIKDQKPSKVGTCPHTH